MQHPEYEWWTKFQTSTDLTSNWAQQEGSACIPQIYFLQTKLPVHICIPLYKRGFELWTETDQPKGVENMYAEGSNSTVTYVKEIKLYLVISTITSSLKQFQQLFLSGASECLWFLRKSTKNFILSDASKCLLFRANFHWRQRFVLFATFLVINFPGILKQKKFTFRITLGSWRVQFPHTY